MLDPFWESIKCEVSGRPQRWWVKLTCSGIRLTIWIQTSIVLPTSCVILDNLFNFSVLQFAHL